jgi:hypothetical protein
MVIEIAEIVSMDLLGLYRLEESCLGVKMDPEDLLNSRLG